MKREKGRPQADDPASAQGSTRMLVIPAPFTLLGQAEAKLSELAERDARRRGAKKPPVKTSKKKKKVCR